VFRLLWRSYVGIVGVLLLFLFTLTAVFAPWIAPYPQDAKKAVHLERMLQPPSREHLLGTDDMGRDILSRILFGARISLAIGVISIFFACSIGALLGMIAGYIGGLLDEIIMRIADIFMSVPYVILGMAVAVALRPGTNNVVIAISVAFWPATARLMRGQVLSIREKEYVEASKASGGSAWWVMMVHIAPNSIAPIVVQATIQIGWAILLAATLGFIGVGVQPPLPEWGLITSTGRQYMLNAWWYPAFPGLAIVITVIAFNLIGDALRDILDPYLRGGLLR